MSSNEVKIPTKSDLLLIQSECEMNSNYLTRNLPHGFIAQIQKRFNIKYCTALRLCKSFTANGDVNKPVSQNNKLYKKDKSNGKLPGRVNLLKNPKLMEEYNKIGQQFANSYNLITAADMNWLLVREGFVETINTTRRHLKYNLHARLVKMEFVLKPIKSNPNYDPYKYVFHPDEKDLEGSKMEILVWKGISIPTASACPTYKVYDAGETVFMVSEDYKYRYYPKKVHSLIACKCQTCLYKLIDNEKRNKLIKDQQMERYHKRLMEYKEKVKVRDEKMKRWANEKEIFHYLFYDLDWKGKIDATRREFYIDCLDKECEEMSEIGDIVSTVCFDDESECDQIYSDVRMSEGGTVSVFSENVAGDNSVAYDVNGDEIASECCDNSRGDTEEGEAREGDYSHVKGSDEDDSESEYTPDSEFNFLNFI